MGQLARDYGLPLGITALVLIVLVVLARLFASRGIASGLWRGIRANRATTLLLSLALLLGVGLSIYFERASYAESVRRYASANLLTAGNLLADPQLTSLGTLTSTLSTWTTNMPLPTRRAASSSGNIILNAGGTITSSIILVRPGSLYRSSLYTLAPDSQAAGTARVRMLWLDRALNTLSWEDAPTWQADAGSPGTSTGFHTGLYTAPAGAAALRMVVANIAPTGEVILSSPQLSAVGAYVEPNPNGTEGSLAFSFDWESAMGGAIHSKGMDPHDPAGAAQHGIDMRQGADWLAQLFASHGITATFYATGYNLLDGNTERNTFAGDPTYNWANRKTGWGSDYWLTHKWYSDDPYGTVQSAPAWYFGDQTRKLLAAGHEIAPHTFGHLYVRGTTPAQLSTDMAEWLRYSEAAGVPAPTTFAFPWRSSNSLTRDFYDVFYKDGIRAVTRVYEADLRDRYTLGAPYHTDKDPSKSWVYAGMAVMPDFLLGSPSATMGEENGGAGLSDAAGTQVISSTLLRRGTTSFWQHPEQLADSPSFAGVRDTWSKVVGDAADMRGSGRLWISTVAEITTYQRDVMSVTTTLDSSLFGGWHMGVTNSSGKTLSGVTLTLPGAVASARSAGVTVRTVQRPDNSGVRVSSAASPEFPANQLVLDNLKPGSTTIDIGWAPGQEPPR